MFVYPKHNKNVLLLIRVLICVYRREMNTRVPEERVANILRLTISSNTSYPKVNINSIMPSLSVFDILRDKVQYAPLSVWEAQAESFLHGSSVQVCLLSYAIRSNMLRL